MRQIVKDFTEQVNIKREQPEVLSPSIRYVFTAKWADGDAGLIHQSWIASDHPLPHWVSLSGSEGSIYLEIEGPRFITCLV